LKLELGFFLKKKLIIRIKEKYSVPLRADIFYNSNIMRNVIPLSKLVLLSAVIPALAQKKLSVFPHFGMKRPILVIVLLLTAAVTVSAQKVYSADHDYQAKVKVFVVDHDYQADLLVYKEDHDYQATGNEGKWFFVDKDYQADVTIYFVDHDYQADLKIFFVKHEYQAGWKNKSKKHLMYGNK